MTRDAHTLLAIVQPLDLILDVKRAEITLDENRAPYGEVRLTCPLPGEADRTALDLRDESLRLDLRVRRDFGRPWSVADITAAGGEAVAGWTDILGGEPLSVFTAAFYRPWNGSQVRAAQRRTFDLYVLERLFDDVAKELTIIATTDEAQLLTGALVDSAFYDPGTVDLAEIVALVLDRYGLSLSADSETATVAEAEGTIQRPGVTDWDYLHSMLEAASLRLWCDEAGVFRISTRPATAEGTLALSAGASMTGNSDRMTFDPEVWFEAVVVHYAWTDVLGVSFEAWDVAGDMPARAVKTFERPGVIYPGPGAAAAILGRQTGRGRVLEVSNVSDYTATPGMAVVITPPDTLAQSGYLQSVSWSIPEAEMRVSTRGLVDTPEDAYLFGDETTFADVAISAPTLEIEDFEWSLV